MESVLKVFFLVSAVQPESKYKPPLQELGLESRRKIRHHRATKVAPESDPSLLQKAYYRPYLE